MAPRDWEEAQEDTLEPTKERMPGEIVQRNVTYVRKLMTGLALLAVLVCVYPGLSKTRSIFFLKNTSDAVCLLQ